MRPNVVMEVWKLDRMSSPVIGLAARKGEQINGVFQDHKIVTLFNRSDIYDDVDAAIELPRDLIEESITGKNHSFHNYRTAENIQSIFRHSMIIYLFNLLRNSLPVSI